MDERARRLLNPTEAIINHLPVLIEAFVEFYGEEERENITNKFNHMVVIGYSNPSDLSSIIETIDSQKSDEIKEMVLNRCTDSKEEYERLKQILFHSYSLQHTNLHPINEYITYKENVWVKKIAFKRNKVVKFLKQIYPETTEENVDELIENGTFKSIDAIISIYKEELKKYHQFQEEIKPYQNYTDKCLDYKQELERKYTKIFIESLKDLFTEEEYLQVVSVINENDFAWYDLEMLHNSKINNYCGTKFQYGMPLIYSFSEKNEEILQKGTEWKKESIKKDRIKYFKNFGLDLGDDYEAYINDPRTKELMPSKELIARITNTKNDLYKKMINEYYTSLPTYQQNREKIDKLELLSKEDGYDAQIFEDNITCTIPNVKLENGEHIEYPIVLICLNDDEYLDHNLIHELNHMYEIKLICIKNNKCKYRCGFETLEGNISNQTEEEPSLDDDNNKRDYELFSEIINELIAQEISEILTNKGIYIFNTRENKKIKDGTSYEETMFLVLEFYETYKKEIIEARKTGNIEILYGTVGKENFEELNGLFYEYYENFYLIGPFALDKVKEDLKNNVETPETIKYKELITRRDIILANMKEHYQSQAKGR